MKQARKKVIICIPTRDRPHDACLASLEAEAPLLDAAGWDNYIAAETGSPYISHARATMLRKALDKFPDAVVFVDDDVSWTPGAVVKLLQAKGDVVAGLYRFKTENVEYMGELRTGPSGRVMGNDDGLLVATKVPAGFLKLTIRAVDVLFDKYPALIYGKPWYPQIDLFNHGAHASIFPSGSSGRMWWGVDYAFSQRWIDTGEPLYVLPDLDLTHNGKDKAYPGNYHQHLLRCPGGALEGEK